MNEQRIEPLEIPDGYLASPAHAAAVRHRRRRHVVRAPASQLVLSCSKKEPCDSLLPLVFGMFLIIPPQVFYERLFQGQWHGGFLQFFWSARCSSGPIRKAISARHHLVVHRLSLRVRPAAPAADDLVAQSCGQAAGGRMDARTGVAACYQ